MRGVARRWRMRIRSVCTTRIGCRVICLSWVVNGERPGLPVRRPDPGQRCEWIRRLVRRLLGPVLPAGGGGGVVVAAPDRGCRGRRSSVRPAGR